MFQNLLSLFKRKELCTECGKPFKRLEWGGRMHYTSKGSSYIHNMDIIYTLGLNTFEEKRQAINKLEATQLFIRNLKKQHNDRFCESHYMGCPL